MLGINLFKCNKTTLPRRNKSSEKIFFSLQDDIDFNSPSIQQHILEAQAKICRNGSIPHPGNKKIF